MGCGDYIYRYVFISSTYLSIYLSIYDIANIYLPSIYIFFEDIHKLLTVTFLDGKITGNFSTSDPRGWT